MPTFDSLTYLKHAILVSRVVHQPKEWDQNDCDDQDTEQQTDQESNNHKD